MGRGQKKNGEMIKYSAAKISRPNSARLPTHPVLQAWLARCTSARLGRGLAAGKTRTAPTLGLVPAAQRGPSWIAFSPVPSVLVPCPLSPSTSPRVK